MYEVFYNYKSTEEFETIFEAEEFIDYKVTHWPEKYNIDLFDIKKI